MAEKQLKSIKFPGLEDIYVIPSLPFVTDEDNDKILRVVNGAWTAVALQYAEEVSV